MKILLYTGKAHRWSTVIFSTFQNEICNTKKTSTEFSLHLHTKSFHIQAMLLHTEMVVKAKIYRIIGFAVRPLDL